MFGVLRPGSPERDHIPVSPTAPPPPPGSLAPIPLTEFNSREELLEGCKEWAASQGYAVVISRSRFHRLWLKCDRGGKYENRRGLTPDQRKRKRGESRLLGCPFKAIGQCKKERWRVDTEISTHNHDPSDDLSAHPTLRRMTDPQLQKVHDMFDAGKSPAETLEALRDEWPDIKVLTRDIYNARKKYKTEKDEAGLAEGNQKQSYQDPNELGLVGPNPNGRWAWVPDGEEVTNKKSKRKRRSAPPAQIANNPTLDPQLQGRTASNHSHNMSTTAQALQNGSSDTNDPAAQLRGAAQYQPGRNEVAHNPIDRPVTASEGRRSTGFNRNANSGPTLSASYPAFTSTNRQPDKSPSQVHSQKPTASTAAITAPSAAGDTNIPNSKHGEPKAQVLMSRIERMEKEQRDQKDMLAQILGAVQGFQGSPGSDRRS